MVPPGSAMGLARGTGIVVQAGPDQKGSCLKHGAAGWLSQGRPELGPGARQRLWRRVLPSKCGIEPPLLNHPWGSRSLVHSRFHSPEKHQERMSRMLLYCNKFIDSAHYI